GDALGQEVLLPGPAELRHPGLEHLPVPVRQTPVVRLRGRQFGFFGHHEPRTHRRCPLMELVPVLPHRPSRVDGIYPDVWGRVCHTSVWEGRSGGRLLRGFCFLRGRNILLHSVPFSIGSGVMSDTNFLVPPPTVPSEASSPVVQARPAPLPERRPRL